jgi:CAI-1 autoinducer synthase
VQGDIAPLVAITDIAQQYDCILVVDESHSLGIYGPYGEGLVVALGLTQKVHFRTASLAKAFVGRGGMITGSSRHIDYIRYEALPNIFSSAVLPYEAAGFSATIDVIREDEWRRKKLKENAEYFKRGLSALGYNISVSESQIVPLEGGYIKYTNLTRQVLESRGIYGAVFWAPATAKNRSLVRLTVTAGLSQEQLDYTLNTLEEIRDTVHLSEWSSTTRQVVRPTFH